MSTPAFTAPSPLRAPAQPCAAPRRAPTCSLTRRAALQLAVAGSGALYDAWASRYEILDGRTALTDALGLTSARHTVLSRAHGDVLELAVGTGVNLPLYERDALASLTAADASAAMLQQAASRARKARATLVQADVAALPFADAMFDTVVDTFSLCTFEQPLEALREMRRVLRPTQMSRLLLVEHAASDVGVLRAYQDAVADVVTTLSKGCVWNQRVEDLVKEAGFFTVERRKLLAGTVLVLEMSPVEV